MNKYDHRIASAMFAASIGIPKQAVYVPLRPPAFFRASFKPLPEGVVGYPKPVHKPASLAAVATPVPAIPAPTAQPVMNTAAKPAHKHRPRRKRRVRDYVAGFYKMSRKVGNALYYMLNASETEKEHRDKRNHPRTTVHKRLKPREIPAWVNAAFDPINALA